MTKAKYIRIFIRPLKKHLLCSAPSPSLDCSSACDRHKYIVNQENDHVFIESEKDEETDEEDDQKAQTEVVDLTSRMW